MLQILSARNMRARAFMYRPPVFVSPSLSISSTALSQLPLHSVATRSFSIYGSLAGSKILCSVQSNIHYVQVKVGIPEKERQKYKARAAHRKSDRDICRRICDLGETSTR